MTVRSALSLGVEEEYQLVDPRSGRLLPRSRAVMRRTHRGGEATGSQITHELHLTQIEMASPVCRTLQDVHDRITETRRVLIRSAREAGAALISAGTNPLTSHARSDITPIERYRSMTEQYQQIARELVIFGCHVHVGLEDKAAGVQLMNHAGQWLPVLQALSANSPFWHGQNTGYASFRRELWVQWPMAGPPLPFNDFEEYQATVANLIKAGAIEDASRIYWDVRLPERLPTIEFRVADALTRVEETVVFAGLIRGLVAATLERIAQGMRPPRLRPEVLRFAMWQAARYGVNDQLINCATAEPEPAEARVRALLSFVQEPLEQMGDWERVRSGVELLLRDGTGADRQWKAFEERGDLQDVIAMLIDDTGMGTGVEAAA